MGFPSVGRLAPMCRWVPCVPVECSSARPPSPWCLIRCWAPLYVPTVLSICSQRCAFPSVTSSLERNLRNPLSDLTFAFIVTGLPWPHGTHSWLFGNYILPTIQSLTRFTVTHHLVDSYFIGHIVTLTSLAWCLHWSHTLNFPDQCMLHSPCFFLKEGCSYPFKPVSLFWYKAVAA